MAPGQKLIAKKDFKPHFTKGRDYQPTAMFHDDDTVSVVDDMGHEFNYPVRGMCEFFEAPFSPSFGTWYSIESAPKDGSKLLLYGKPWSDPVIGQYHTRDKYWMALNLMPYHYPPTHWTPLPELPKE